MEFTIIKSRALTLSRSPQYRAFSRAVMDEKSLSPHFTVGVGGGGQWLQMTALNSRAMTLTRSCSAGLLAGLWWMKSCCPPYSPWVWGGGGRDCGYKWMVHKYCRDSQKVVAQHTALLSLVGGSKGWWWWIGHVTLWNYSLANRLNSTKTWRLQEWSPNAGEMTEI